MVKLTNIKPRLGSMGPRVRPPPKRVDPFYVSPEWKALVSEVKAERGNFCETCGAGGKGVRIIGDHDKEIKDGGARLDKANIKLKCGRCHARKTAKARAARARGQTYSEQGGHQQG